MTTRRSAYIYTDITQKVPRLSGTDPLWLLAVLPSVHLQMVYNLRPPTDDDTSADSTVEPHNGSGLGCDNTDSSWVVDEEYVKPADLLRFR